MEALLDGPIGDGLDAGHECRCSTFEGQDSTPDDQAAFAFYIAEQESITKLVRKVIRGAVTRRAAQAGQYFDDAMSEALRVVPMAMRTYDPHNQFGASLKTHVLGSIRWYVWKLFNRLKRIDYLTTSNIGNENPNSRRQGIGGEHFAPDSEAVCKSMAGLFGLIVTDERAEAELESKQEVEYLLTKLSPEHALLLRFRYIQEMPLEEIGRLFGASKGRIHGYIEAAMRELRKLVADRDWAESTLNPRNDHART